MMPPPTMTTCARSFIWASALQALERRGRIHGACLLRLRSVNIDAVDREVEDLMALQRARRRPRRVLRAERVAQDERHLGFGDAAVAAEAMALEPREIMRGLGRADAGIDTTDHHHVPLPVGRQVEDPHGGGLVVDGLDAG